MINLRRFTFWAATAVLLAAVAVQAVPIVSGYRWKDTNGKYIQAHGGGIYKLNNVYYWVGEDKSDDTGAFQGFHMYSSTDLATWTDKGLALSPSSQTTPVGERPKIIYNAKNKQYVMWFHAEDSGYALAQTGVATSSSIGGPYTFQGAFRPLGMESRDMSVYVDDDGTGYLLFATNGNADFAIATMNADYTNVTDVVYTFSGVRYEGSGLIKKDGKYYLIVSYQSGWQPNDNVVLEASSLRGPYSSPAGIAPSGLATYNSQNNFDLVDAGSSGTTYMYMGDRWRSDKLGQSTYVWQRLQFDATSGLPSIQFADAWDLNAAAGTSSSYATTAYSVAKSATLSGAQTVLADCSACMDGKVATYVGNDASSKVTFTGVRTPNNVAGSFWVAVHYIDYDRYPTYRNATVSANNGNGSQNIEFAPGGSSTVGTQSVPVLLPFNAGDNTVIVSNAKGYAPDISHITVYQTS